MSVHSSFSRQSKPGWLTGGNAWRLVEDSARETQKVVSHAAEAWNGMTAGWSVAEALKLVYNLVLVAVGVASVCAIAASMATFFALSVLLLVAPTGRLFTQPLFFDYTLPTPAASVDFRASLQARHMLPQLQAGTSCVADPNLAQQMIVMYHDRPWLISRVLTLEWLRGPAKELPPVGCGEETEQVMRLRPLSPGQRFNVDIELRIPESDQNADLFQVMGTLSTSTGFALARASRPAMLPYRSSPVAWARTLFLWPLTTVGLMDEARTVRVRLFDDVVEGSIPVVAMNVTVHARHGGGLPPQVVSARAVITRRLGLIGRALFHIRPSWPVCTAIYALCALSFMAGAAGLTGTLYLALAAPEEATTSARSPYAPPPLASPTLGHLTEGSNEATEALERESLGTVTPPTSESEDEGASEVGAPEGASWEGAGEPERGAGLEGGIGAGPEGRAGREDAPEEAPTAGPSLVSEAGSISIWGVRVGSEGPSTSERGEGEGAMAEEPELRSSTDAGAGDQAGEEGVAAKGGAREAAHAPGGEGGEAEAEVAGEEVSFFEARERSTEGAESGDVCSAVSMGSASVSALASTSAEGAGGRVESEAGSAAAGSSGTDAPEGSEGVVKGGVAGPSAAGVRSRKKGKRR